MMARIQYILNLWKMFPCNNDLPTRIFTFLPNYPNPFNPVTNIRFGIPEISEVNITIYDLLGKKIREWSYSELSPGWYDLRWDGTNDYGKGVSTGIYVFTMSSGNYRDTRKMLLMK